MFLTIMTWTEGKALYVQAICGSIIETYSGVGQVPDDWKIAVEENVFENTRSILRDFYTGNNLDTLTKNILALLANKPDLTVKQIAKRLGNSVKVIGDKINDLVSLDKVSRHGAEYRIVGTLIEEWGKRNLDVPTMKSSWPQRLKWGVTIAFIVIAVLIIPYTHPGLQKFEFTLSNEVVFIELPSSLEQGETGKAEVTIQNTSSNIVAATHIFLYSSSINYQLNGSNQLAFTPIALGENKTLEPTYTVDSMDCPISTSLTTQLLITQEQSNLPISRNFMITGRCKPLQKYWYLASLLIGALGLCILFLTNVINFLKGKDK
jgi:hypothetical protein